MKRYGFIKSTQPYRRAMAPANCSVSKFVSCVIYKLIFFRQNAKFHICVGGVKSEGGVCNYATDRSVTGWDRKIQHL